MVKTAVFMELVTWLEQATFSLRGLALAVFICIFLLLSLENLCVSKNSMWKSRKKVSIEFYQFLSYSKSGRQRVDIFQSAFLDYGATFPYTCECKSTGTYFLRVAQIRTFEWIHIGVKSDRNIPHHDIFLLSHLGIISSTWKYSHFPSAFSFSPSCYIEAVFLVNVLFIFEKLKFFKLFLLY